MNGHPGGLAHTKRMVSLSGLNPPSTILDMGAGDGTAVRFLQELGYIATGIDRIPPGPDIISCDFLKDPLPNAAYDGVLSQCTFYVSGDVNGAFCSAFHVLKPGGVLMLSDVCPRGAALTDLAEAAGFTVLYQEDLTSLWKEYYIEAIWRGTAEALPCHPKMTYQLLIAKKGGSPWI